MRQRACSRVIALMCELCGGSEAISWHDSFMVSTLIAVCCEHKEVMPVLIDNSDTDWWRFS